MIYRKKLYPLYLLRQYLSLDTFADYLKIRRKPRVIQLPITSRCNSRCITCNIWKVKDNTDINPEKLTELFQDAFFNKVTDVGINGGEITLVQNFDNILDSVLSLKRLNAIHLISNGLLPQKLLPLLESAKRKCMAKGVLLNIAISIDGIDNVQSEVRGVPNCFKKSEYLLNELKHDPKRYADNITIGCTLSKKNIPYVIQTDEYLKRYPFYVQYHLAVPNKRIHTFDDADRYFILNDEHCRLLAEEFFLGKFLESDWTDRYSYFCQYYFLKTHGRIRLAPCSYKYRDLTIDEHMKLYLCATASEVLGDFNTENLKDILNNKRFEVVQNDILKNCNNCIHYTYNKPTLYGFYLFVKTIVCLRWNLQKKYKIKNLWK